MNQENLDNDHFESMEGIEIIDFDVEKGESELVFSWGIDQRTSLQTDINFQIFGETVDGTELLLTTTDTDAIFPVSQSELNDYYVNFTIRAEIDNKIISTQSNAY